jgi:restriction endonuclease S subunit
LSAWPVVKLSDVATLSSGGTPSKANLAFWGGDIPWVSPKDMKFNHIIDAEDKITREAVSESAARIVGSNSVLVVVRSGILAHTFPVATLARDVSFNQDIKAITPKNGSLLPAFLFWMLKGQEPQILSIGVKKGATVHSLANGFLEALSFPLPPLDEQRRIASLLDRAAAIRRRADAARAQARAIIPALFLDTFGDPATNPKGWPVATVGSITKSSTGSIDPHRTPDAEFNYIDIGSIDTLTKSVSNPKLILGSVAPSRARKCVAFNDVVVSMTRPNLNAVAVIGSQYERPVASTGLAILRPLECTNTWFVFSFATSRYFVDQLSAKVAGGLYPAVTEGQIRGLPVFLPPLPLQMVFAEQVLRINATASALDAAAAKAEAMAAALSAEVFG